MANCLAPVVIQRFAAGAVAEAISKVRLRRDSAELSSQIKLFNLNNTDLIRLVNGFAISYHPIDGQLLRVICTARVQTVLEVLVLQAEQGYAKQRNQYDDHHHHRSLLFRRNQGPYTRNATGIGIITTAKQPSKVHAHCTPMLWNICFEKSGKPAATEDRRMMLAATVDAALVSSD